MTPSSSDFAAMLSNSAHRVIPQYPSTATAQFTASLQSQAEALLLKSYAPAAVLTTRGGVAANRIAALEAKLQQAEEALQTAREEMQTSQEELQSSNEELQSTKREALLVLEGRIKVRAIARGEAKAMEVVLRTTRTVLEKRLTENGAKASKEIAAPKAGRKGAR